MMESIVRFLLLFCIVLSIANTSSASEESSAETQNAKAIVEPQEQVDTTEVDAAATEQSSDNGAITEASGRSIAVNYEVQEDQHELFKKRAKPLKNIFMGIYKNYKSTYLGNRTSTEYKKKLRERLQSKTNSIISNIEQQHEASVNSEQADATEPPQDTMLYTEPAEETKLEVEAVHNLNHLEAPKEDMSVLLDQVQKLNKKRRKRKRKHTAGHKTVKTNKRIKVEATKEPLSYGFGAGVNMSLDMENDIVNVKLNADNLLEILQGRWLSDNSEEGRGKKYDMVTKILPLFILPFLIQSAIVPFLVTKLKLLLMKSILVGKLAIFLLVISAIKNSSKTPQAYEVGPSYWAGEPSRRSELAAAASSAAYNGYRVEGKPTTWIN